MSARLWASCRAPPAWIGCCRAPQRQLPGLGARGQRQGPPAQPQARHRRAPLGAAPAGWRLRARRPADQPSDSEEEEDYFSEGDEAVEYYDSDDVGFEEAPGPGGGDVAMRLYLDSADVQEWGKWAEVGIFYGFTTNPTILKRDDVPCTVASMRHLAREAFALKVEELQLQAWGASAAELRSCGLDLSDIDPERIVVKLPITLEGAKAARLLIEDGVAVTMTGVHASHQVITALAIGAAYAAPYVGRMTDGGKNGVEEVVKMQAMVDQSSEPGGMRLLVASIRAADELVEMAVKGANTFTISPAVAAQLFGVQQTTDAARVFQEHAEEMRAPKD